VKAAKTAAVLHPGAAPLKIFMKLAGEKLLLIEKLH
jgi:hypothetical protein